MARSANDGDPFTTQNARRLWRISVLVTAGGVADNYVGELAQALIMRQSAASDLFDFEVVIDFSPVIIGLVIAALASIWQHGVTMRDELEATI